MKGLCYSSLAPGTVTCRNTSLLLLLVANIVSFVLLFLASVHQQKEKNSTPALKIAQREGLSPRDLLFSEEQQQRKGLYSDITIR